MRISDWSSDVCSSDLWASLYRPGQVRRRHGLPTYPFARERYWVPRAESVEDCAEIPARIPQERPVDSAPWRPSELADAIDWQARLRHWLGRRILVIHTDDGESQEFRRLLAQGKQASGAEDAADVTYCIAGEVETVLTAARTECLLLLSAVAEPQIDHP